MEIRPYADSDENSVVALWTRVLDVREPHNDPLNSIRRKRAHEKDLFWVAVNGDQVVGTIMGGYDGHRGWIYSLAVDPAHRHQGIASVLMRHLEKLLRDLGCPKVNLQIIASNHEVVPFYEQLGFVVEQRISMGKILLDSL